MMSTISFIALIVSYSFLLESINCALPLNKDESNFYYGANGQNVPVDLDMGSDVVNGMQEKIIVPREVKNDKMIEPTVNGTDNFGWDQQAMNNEPVKRSIRPSKKSKNGDSVMINRLNGDQKKEKNDDSENVYGNAREYEYEDDNGVDNEDVYEDEQQHENDERSELATARAAICNRNRHRLASHAKGNDRNQHQSADEYYEEYDDDSVNRKPNRMGKSRNSRFDVMRR